MIDPDFTKAVLADGRVTLAELEQAYMRDFSCILQTGAGGEAWYYPEVRPSGGYMSIDAADEDMGSAAQACGGLYLEPVLRQYMADHPDTPALRDRWREMSLGCLRERAPSIFAQMDPTWSWDAIHQKAFEIQNSELREDPKTSSVVQSCVDDLGLPRKAYAQIVGNLATSR